MFCLQNQHMHTPYTQQSFLLLWYCSVYDVCICQFCK